MDGPTHEMPPPHTAAPTTPRAEPIETPTFGVVLDALLRSPARLLEAARDREGTLPRLVAITAIATLASGFAMATWSGGAQLLVVPLKLGALAAITALVCVPSLHVLSAMSGGTQSVRETGSALAMGVALTAVLGLALAPIAWVLSAATSSLALAGTLYLAIFLVAVGFGLGLVRRALASSAGTTVRGLGAWSFMFVVVALQLATTLRPLVGEFDGPWLHERTFFLAHFGDCLSGS